MWLIGLSLLLGLPSGCVACLSIDRLAAEQPVFSGDIRSGLLARNCWGIRLCSLLCILIPLWRFGRTWPAVFAIVALFALLLIGWIDAKSFLIPDRLVLLLFCAALGQTIFDHANWQTHLIGLFAISVPLLLLALLTGGMGGGDVKLMAAAGLFLGWAQGLGAFMLGSVLGAIAVLPALLRKEKGRKTEIPFGPWLALGTAIFLLFGDALLLWYFGTFF